MIYVHLQVKWSPTTPLMGHGAKSIEKHPWLENLFELTTPNP